MRRRPAIAWGTAIQVRPVTQPHTAAASDLPPDPIPELRLVSSPFPPRLINLRNGPPRPQVGIPPSPGAGSDTEKLEVPVIAPLLAPEEIAVAQQQTSQSLSIAEKNLESVRGKSLNAAQSDLVSKIRGFLKDAREAARIGDWTRAHSLAKKAQVLSEELAGSL